MKSFNWVNASLIILLSTYYASCKKSDDSAARIKTLDSIASGSLNIDDYQCDGSRSAAITDKKIVFDKKDTKKLSEEKKKEIRSAVKDYFAALPPEVEELFIKMGGQVMITNRTNEICSSSFYGKNLDASKGEQTDGCFHFMSDPGKRKTPIFAVVQSPDTKKIRYYGPQIFGYMYAQFYSRLTISGGKNGLKIDGTEPMQLATLKEDVANAFLSDILTTKNYKLDVLENLIGKNSSDELKGDNIEKPLDKLSFLKDDSRRRQFLDYVFANSFQSAHCNAKSLSVAQSKFKKSSALFERLDASISQTSAALTGKSVPIKNADKDGKKNAKKAEFGLAEGDELSLAGGDVLSTVMPLVQNIMGMFSGGAGGGQGAAAPFMNLLSGGGGGGGGGAGGTMGLVSNIIGGVFNLLSDGGCEGGNCGGVAGGCSGGACSSCGNGSCGGCSGSCQYG
jgi:hypothetical protein